jgi:uncharacterized membrane protein
VMSAEPDEGTSQVLLWKQVFLCVINFKSVFVFMRCYKHVSDFLRLYYIHGFIGRAWL